MRLLYILCFTLFLSSTCLGQTITELKRYVTYFASDDCRGRDTGSKGYDKAAQYVFNHCKKYGLKVKFQPVSGCKNVIAWLEGYNLNKVVVIGAHLDHVGVNRGGIRNGADDNASGSAAILGLAKRFSTSKPRYTLVFQWYTGEERGFLGSKYYVKNPLLPESQPSIKMHIFMLNLDMVGRLRISQRAYGDLDIPSILENLYSKYPFAKRITFRENRASDHVVFARDMPVVWLFTGTHNDYHRTTDTADKINYEGMVKVCNYANDLIHAVMGSKEVPDYKIWESLPTYEGMP